jgi:hypothetical protein
MDGGKDELQQVPVERIHHDPCRLDLVLIVQSRHVVTRLALSREVTTSWFHRSTSTTSVMGCRFTGPVPAARPSDHHVPCDDPIIGHTSRFAEKLLSTVGRPTGRTASQRPNLWLLFLIRTSIAVCTL